MLAYTVSPLPAYGTISSWDCCTCTHQFPYASVRRKGACVLAGRPHGSPSHFFTAPADIPRDSILALASSGVKSLGLAHCGELLPIVMPPVQISGTTSSLRFVILARRKTPQSTPQFWIQQVSQGVAEHIYTVYHYTESNTGPYSHPGSHQHILNA